MGVEERYKKRQGLGENKSVYNGVEARYVNNNWNTISSNLNSRINSWLQKNNSYMSTYQTRVSGLTGTYKDKYDSGVSDWLSAITTQKTNLETEASELKSELETYKDYLGDNYSKVLSLLDSATKAQSDVIKGATDYSKYWSNWETEDAYNEWAASMKDREEMLTFNLEEGKAEIERLQGYAKMWDEAASSVQSLRISIEQKEQELAYGHFVDRDKLQREITAEKGKLAGYESILEQLDGAKVKKDLPQKQAYYTQAERLQNAEALKNNAINASDFETYAAKGAAIKNPTPKEAENGVYIFGNRLGGDVEIGNVVTYSRDNYEAMAFGEMNGGGSQYGKSIYHFMTDDEVKIYNYYIGKGDKTNAQKYLDSLEETLNQRHGGMVFENLEGNTALEMVFGVAAGLDQFRSGVVNLFNGEDYIPTSSVQFTSGMIREDLADAGDGVNIFGSSLGQAAYDAITTTSNMLPSILVGAGMNAVLPGVGSAVGSALLSASAAGNAKAEMLNLGYSKDQANGYALLVGASEGALQYLLGGISSLGGKLTGDVAAKVLGKVDNALARVAIQTGLGMLGEGIEEGLQTALEPWFKSLVGLDYEAPEIDEILYSGLLGAISAFGLEGAGNTSAAVQTSKVGKDIKQIDGGVQKLIEAGQTYSADSVAFKLASKIDENTGAYTIGRLFIEEGATLSEQNKTEIIEGLKSLGVNSSDAQSLARTYELYLNESVQLTDAQKRLLEKTSPLSRVLREKIIGENTTVYQRTKGYTDLSRLANEVANGKKNSTVSKMEQVGDKAEATDAAQDGERTMLRATNAPYASAQAEASTDPVEAAVRRVRSEVVADSRLSATEKNLKSNKALVDAAAKSALKVKGEYTANETGVTRVKDSNERVRVTDVVSTENGQLKVRLNNNKVVDAKELSFSSPDEALVYEAVANMGVDPASAMSVIKGFDPKGNQSGATYALGMIEAYTYGQHNITEISERGFTSWLSEVQKKTAYDLGRIKSRADAAADQAKVDTAVKESKKKQNKPVAKRKGEVVYDESVDKSSLSESQNAQISVVEKVAEKLGTRIHFFASSITEKGRGFTTTDGDYTTENGWYDPKTGEIWIDVNAGVNGNGLIIYTASHELTHFIKEWSPEKYKVFADFLVKTYGEHGKSINKLVRERMANSKYDLSYDEAFDEVVARSCESFLQDSNAAVKIAALRERDASLAQKIKSFLGQLLAKVRKLAKELGLAPDSTEGKLVAEMTDSLEKMYDLWTDALADAGRAYSAAGVAIDSNTESVAPQFSERTWTASEYVTERNAAAKRLAEKLGVTLKQATKYIDNVNSIAKAIANDRARLDYEASSFGSAFVSNVEYGGSFDFTTLCKKRRIYTGTFQEIQKQIGDNALTPDDILEIRNMMIEGGIEATCGLCYVEGSRANMGKFAKEFIKVYKRDNPDGWTPTMVDVNTPDGVEQMRINHPEAYERYEYFWNHYGKLQDSDPALFASQQKPKLYEARKEYKGEILQHFDDVEAIAKKNLNGGIRMQSFSDFEIVHLIDTMQIIMDMANVGLAGQAYTKVPEFAEAFGNTGLKINLSLIAKGVDADGKLIFDDREGMPAQTAFKLRDKYSSNVGTILVIFTDEQLKAAMADPRVDFIIPFHRSQWKKSQYGAMGLPKGTKDYTFMQNEKLIKATYHEYRGRMVKDKASNYMPNEYWDFSKSGKENAEAYLEMCAANNKRPKFYKFLDHDGKGNYSLKKDGSTDGYWKLLIDFKMYDNDGVGSPQRAVTPDFSMDEAMTMLDEYKGGHQSYPIAHGVVDKFIEGYKEKGKVKYSERDFASQVDAVLSGADTNNSHLKLMDTPTLLQEAGLPNLPILMTAKHLKTITSTSTKGNANYHGLDVEIVKKLPEYISDPVLMADSLTREDSIVIITEAIDSENRPVIAAIMLNGKGALDDRYIDANIMTSAYGKDNFQSFLDRIADNNAVIYWDEKKSRDLSVNLGLQLPNIITSLDSGTIIHPAKAFVKSKSKKMSERDSDYLDAVNRGDMETAQRMVDEAAWEAGYRTHSMKDGSPSKVFHGTQAKFTVFSHDAKTVHGKYFGKGFYFTDSEKAAEFFAGKGTYYYNPETADFDLEKEAYVMGVYLDMGRCMSVNAQHFKSLSEVERVAYNAFSKNPDCDGLVVYNIKDGTDDLSTVYVVKNSNQVKSADPVTYDDNGDVIPLTERFDPENNDIRYSERDPDAVSNREILATSLESAAQNDIEKRRLAEYKKKAENLDAEQAKLAEVKRRIHDLSFSKGKRDMATLKNLKEMATRIEARINTYDKQLLSLEATKPIKDVLTREKDLVRKREQEKAKENFTIYKEHAEKRQAERDEYYRDIIRRNREAARDSKERAIAKVKQANRDSRERSEERRDKTTMRNKIRKQVESLNTLLLNPTKEKHIPMHLQKPVAEMLALVNMESSNSESMKEKLQLLKVAYDEIIESDDPIIAGSYHPEVSERIGNLANLVGDTALKDMTLEQLDYLYDSFKILETIVRNANKGFKIAKGQTISSYSNRVMEEIHKVGGSGHMSNKLLDGISQYTWNNLKPVYAFERIGSETFTELFDNVRAGEDTWATDVSEAREFFLSETKKHGFYDWDMEETHTFEGKFGKKFDLTLQQMMSLYAYSKRAQADKHLEDGGFVFEDAVIVAKKKFGVPIKYTVKKANPHSLAREHLAAVVGALTDSQRAFVDEMQEYLSSTMGAKGNEVSREMYGIDLFKEKYYFPLKSSNYYMSYNPEKDAQARIKNYGMAKETVKHANNPIVLSDFMSVWGNHIDEMSMYHAFVLPLEDFSRVFNYNTPTSEEYNKESVQQYLADAYGDEAISYIKNLLTDLNGGARTDPTIGWANKLIGRFKKAKVFLSASVVVQQPSAIGRAFAYINPKYFTPNLKQKHGEAWAEVKKYAPVAIIKEMGYFDTNVGKSTVDYITAREYEGLKEKAKGIFTDSNYRDEAMGKLPALADEATWNQIWQAVKNEIADTTDLERGSEEFLTAAGKRFTEVVTKTQVYDSVLSKSAFMRSKDGLAKMITAFLAEPTTSINMIGNAIIQGERGNKKLARNIVGGVAASVILNSVLVSLVYAARDDDEDETFTEKYIESLTTELLEGINPATYLPYIKDIWSLAQGYDIERTDMSLFSDLMAAVKSMFSESKSGWEKTEELATTVADLFGLPLNNVLRDAKALYNTAKSFVDGAETTGTGIAASIGDAIRSSIPFGDKILPEASKKQRLYDAVIGGDETQIARMKALFKDNAAIESALRSALRESDSRITKAAKAHLEGNVSERVRLAKEIIAEGNFSQDHVVAAINAEINALKKKAEEDSPETTEPEEETEEVISYYRADDINAALEGGDTKLALEIIEDLVATKTSNGMEEKNAKSSIKSSVTSYWKPLYKKAYKNKDAEEMKRIRNLLYASGLYGRPSEVLETVKKWLKDS